MSPMNEKIHGRSLATDVNSKKKYSSFAADNSHGESKPQEGSPPLKTTGAFNGVSFIGKGGPLDCSIGSIFRDEFGKSLKMPKPSQQRGRALSVLIIDDSVIQRKLTIRTLGGLIDEVNWMVEGVENGECALNLMETSPRVPDVIIVDQYMETSGGRLLGHEVVAELRSSSAFDSAVIIGCTGSVDTAEAHFLKAGCDVVWSKPMPSKEEAQKQIITLLQGRKSTTLFAQNGLSIGQTDSNHDLNQLSSQIPMFSQGSVNGDNTHADTSTLTLSQKKSSSLNEPVFRQIQSSQVSSNQRSYFVTTPTSTTAHNIFNMDNVNTPVFNFGSPPVAANKRIEEMNHVAEGISNINVVD